MRQSNQQRLDILEVKTIYERSHEDDSNVSSALISPGGTHRKEYMSGNEQHVTSNVVTEYQVMPTDESKAPSKSIQILDLLNDICEENEEEDIMGKNMLPDSSRNQESVTEKEEDKIMEEIMRLQ